jgi:glyceraldehyde 3-phosphate dehydrogenase
MALKVAINGFGRIGRSVARIVAAREDVELVAINDLASMDMIEYLLANDSVHGTFDQEVSMLDDSYIQIGDMKVKVLSDRDPKNLNFADFGAEVVLECTGVFLTKEAAQVHIDNGAKKVIFSAPAKDDSPTYVIGVNENEYKGEEIISNASCTTNCLGPVAKVLDDAFGIEKGLMTTIHSYTNDQSILDVKHRKDKRRARAAAVNMIPTTTGAAKAIGKVLPQLQGKLHGQSVRVPTPNVSMVDLNVVVGKDTTKEEINALFTEKMNGELNGIVLVDEEYRVSQDFQGCDNSSIVAADLTQVIEGNMVKVMAWYDNEWGYSTRLVDMAVHVSNFKG